MARLYCISHNCTCVTYWLSFIASKIFIFHVQSTSIIVIFYVQALLVIIIHGSVHLGLSLIIIISHIRYASIIITIDVDLVIFKNVTWIFLASNTINENSIPPPRCCRATPSHKRAMIVASLLWLTFVDKRRGGTVGRRCWSGPSRCAIIFLLPWTTGRIGIPRHSAFRLRNHFLEHYVIVFSYITRSFSANVSNFDLFSIN